MRLCFVVHRYGEEVAGGSETHCRWLAERLAARHEVEIATTCALDYITWRNHYPAGTTRVGGLPVHRFPVRRERDPRRFALQSDLVFHEDHGREDEREWVRENGPESPALVSALPGLGADLYVFYSYRYYQSFFGVPRVPGRAVLVPTAEEDPAIELGVFRSLFQAPRGILYLTPEERALVQGVSGNTAVPDAVIGCGVNVPPDLEGVDARARFGLPARYLLYLGRIDRNKGADVLFDDYRALAAGWPDVPTLVLGGKAALSVPDHPRIRALGYVTEEEKYALLRDALVVLMPSAYESLSMIVLEAWAMGRPVLVNARCRVLEGQCVRSGGGLFYRGGVEFGEALRRLGEDPALRAALGRAGQAYVAREYDWSVVLARTEALLAAIPALR